MQLENKIALISGASSGIGWAIVQSLHSQGATVILVARRQEKLQELARKLGNRVMVMPTDLTDQTAVKKLSENIKDQFGQLDILIHSAGAYTNGSSDETKKKQAIDFEMVELPEMQKVMDINFLGTWLLTQSLINLLKQSQGTIINISSQAAYHGFAGGAAYGVSKFAVRGLMTHLRKELQGQVKVIDIGPGLVDTPLARNFFDLTNEQWEKTLKPEDIAIAVIETINNGQPANGKQPPQGDDEYLLETGLVV